MTAEVGLLGGENESWCIRHAYARLQLRFGCCCGTEDAGRSHDVALINGATDSTHLLENAGVGEVESAALIYFENNLSEYEDKPLDLLTDAGFDAHSRSRFTTSRSIAQICGHC